jgi:hypothetical protein
MKELNHHSKTKWIRKYVKEPREIENLNYLIKINFKLIPSIKTITQKYYIIEKCKPIKPEDFEPSHFYELYLNLLVPLHRFKRESFTPGVYKYFAQYNLSRETNGQHYVPYIMNELEKIVQNLLIHFPRLSEDTIFINLVRYLRYNTWYFENWEPLGGYSLLHGDLHIGNIVKRDNNYLLIDFEYLRYGVVELEVANLVISSLIYHYKKNLNEEKLNNLNTEYLQICNTLPQIDSTLFKFFFIFSLSLFYLSLYIRGKHAELEGIRKITKQMLRT